MSMSRMAGMSTGTATCHWPENHPNNHYRNAAHLSQSKEKSPTFLKRPFAKKKTRKKTNLSHLHPLFLAKNCTLKKKKSCFWAVSTTLTPNPTTQPTQPNCTQRSTSKADAPHGWLGSSRVRPDPRGWSEPLASNCGRSEIFPKQKKTWKKWGRKLLPRHPKGLGKLDFLQGWFKGWFKGL